MRKKQQAPEVSNISANAPPKLAAPLNEMTIATRIVRIRTMTEEANVLLARLKSIKSAIEIDGGRIEIRADVVIAYSVYGVGIEEKPTYIATSSYTANA